MIMTLERVVFTIMIVLATVQLKAHASDKVSDYVRKACSVTKYQDICIHTLASFSNTAKKNPSIWARAGISVTLSETKNVAKYLTRLKNQRGVMKGRNRVALMDCIECFQDATDNLHRSLGILRNLNERTFNAQMSDVTTWMSTVLTDEDTCLDGFTESKRGNKKTKLVRNRVTKVTYITSNALALINKLASTGLHTLNP